MKYFPACACVLLLLVSACSNDDATGLPDVDVVDTTAAKAVVDYDLLRHKITYSQASLAEVRTALTATDEQTLTNIVHALYSMRWLRGVNYLLDDIWKSKRQNAPELNWELLQRAPVRLAVASTLNRILIADTDEHLQYIREHKFDENEFNQAQVVVALGFNGDPADIDYLKSMADGDKPYVVQSAVTGLTLMGGNQARDAMISLWEKYRDKPRGALILDLLKQSYKWQPPPPAPEKQQPVNND